MPTLLTLDEVREHVEADIIDAALERIVDAVEAEMIQKLGPLSSATFKDRPAGSILVLPRKAASITSVVERIEETDYALAASDYRLVDGYSVERLRGGTSGSTVWRGEAFVTYVPVDDEAQRIALLVRLVKLEVEYDAHTRVGADMSRDMKDYTEEKSKLYRSYGSKARRLPIA